MRIQKFLRDHKVGSLRKCDELIQNQQVFVNGEKLTDPTYYLNDGDIVKVGSFTLTHKANARVKHHTYVFNKPKAVLCSHSDDQGRKLITDYFKDIPHFNTQPLFYGGRLDYYSRGLMLISTDGQFIQRMTHPSNNNQKYYLVTTRHPIDYKKLYQISKGTEEYLPFKFELLEENCVRIILTEGRNREIRNLIEMLDNHVIDLQRYQIGTYELKGLKEGQHRKIE